MKPGMQITINSVLYTVDTIGPVTTLLQRGDGAWVHADTVCLNALASAKK